MDPTRTGNQNKNDVPIAIVDRMAMIRPIYL